MIATLLMLSVAAAAAWLMWQVSQGHLQVSVWVTERSATDETFSLISISKPTRATSPRKSKPVTSTHTENDNDEERNAAPVAVRRVFPQFAPTLCICVLSCRRLALLERTVNAVVAHLESSEPDLAYEIVWVDNGSPPDELAAARRRMPRIEKLAALGDNYNIAYGLNTAFFRLCAAPYIVTLEEDWQFVPLAPPLATAARRQIFRNSIAVIEAESDIAGVILRNETFDQFAEPGVWQTLRGSDVSFRKYCAPVERGIVYGAYTNGASIYSRQRLMASGNAMFGEPNNAVGFPPSYSEANFALRIALQFPCSAMIRTRSDCERIVCNGVFEHIGEHQSIMNAQVNADLTRGKNISWIFYDTPLLGYLRSLETKQQR